MDTDEGNPTDLQLMQSPIARRPLVRPPIDSGTSHQEQEISEEIVKEREDELAKRRAAAFAVRAGSGGSASRKHYPARGELERRDRLRMLKEKLMKAHEYKESVIVRLERQLEKMKGEKRESFVPRAVSPGLARSLNQAASLGLECSEKGDDLQLSGCSLSFDGKMIATCSLSGTANVWSMPEVKKVSSLKAHTERATDVAFAPNCYQLATASADKTAKLWDHEGSLLRTFEGHSDRLGLLAFHPSGTKLGTASFDKSWRLWDVETGGEELLVQDGHSSRGVYGIAFHNDGSLVASCGLDSLARVWDLRSGKSVLTFEGHFKPALCASFSPNGYHLATGSEDNTCRIWDMRKNYSLYIIPAHSKLISQVKFEPNEGYLLVTASYDMTAKVWSSRDFKPVKVLSGHKSRITSMDVVGDGQCVVTVSHDRTIKLWASKRV